MKANILLGNESGLEAILNYGSQAVLTGQPQSATQLAAAVDSVSTSDVQNVSLKALLYLILFTFQFLGFKESWTENIISFYWES